MLFQQGQFLFSPESSGVSWNSFNLFGVLGHQGIRSAFMWVRGYNFFKGSIQSFQGFSFWASWSQSTIVCGFLSWAVFIVDFIEVNQLLWLIFGVFQPCFGCNMLLWGGGGVIQLNWQNRGGSALLFGDCAKRPPEMKTDHFIFASTLCVFHLYSSLRKQNSSVFIMSH